MDRTRLILALILSMAVLMAWPLVMQRFFPAPPPAIDKPVDSPMQQPRSESGSTALEPRPEPSAKLSAPAAATQVAERAPITIKTDYWTAKLSNRGAVATSWILTSYPDNGEARDLKPANGDVLELIPANIPEGLQLPLSLRLPWSPELTRQLSEANFEVVGLAPDENNVTLAQGEEKEITFLFASTNVTARKTLKFSGSGFVFDFRAEVVANDVQQPFEVVIGPRVGDQSETHSSSYSLPSAVVAYTRDGSREQIPGTSITAPFASVTAVNYNDNQIQIDKPLASDVDQVKLVTNEGASFLGFARVVSREAGGQSLTLDWLPPGTAQGVGVAQGFDRLKHGYQWAGVADHYFGMLVIPDSPVGEISLTNVQLQVPGHESPVDYPSVALSLRANSGTRIFVGPKDHDLLAGLSRQLGTNLEGLIDYGWFSFMVRPLIPALAWSLKGLAKSLGNYGWAIAVVTVLINVALSPLRFYSSKKMKKAAKHQPRMKELQDRMKKLKENPKKYERELQELQQEQIALMKEANPLGGCMPLLLQMPIFWAAYLYLSSSLDVRHAPWVLWINDLSRPDPYKLLPIIMCITMIASTKLMPQPPSMDPSMKMQRVMMTWLMPIMLTFFFFFSAPSGLVLYWMVSNVVGVAIQLWINRQTAEPAAELAAGGGSSGDSRGGGKTTERAGKKSRKRGQERRAEV